MTSMLDAVGSLMSKVQTQSDSLSKTITDASKADQITDQELLGINFKLGQYNAMMEATSNIAKSTTEMLKTLAQRSS